MPSKKRLFGDIGEETACSYLKKSGYSIIERNYQIKFGELDIIAQKDDLLVFVEVKTSNFLSEIAPEENFTKNKLKKLIKTIEFYLYFNNFSSKTPYRLDLIAVKLNKITKKAVLKHFKNINL